MIPDRELQTFLVWEPQNAKGQLHTSWYTALNTATRMVSEPQWCIGQDPLVCDPRLVRPDTCATAIITQCDLRKDCEVTVLSKVQTYVPLSANGLVAMISRNTTMREWCLDVQHPTTILVSRGTQWITWSEGCTLITDRVSVLRIPIVTGHYHVNNWVLLYHTTGMVQHLQEAMYSSTLPPCYPWMYTEYPISHLSCGLKKSIGWPLCNWYGTLC